MKVLKCWFCGALQETEAASDEALICTCGNEFGTRRKLELKRRSAPEHQIPEIPEASRGLAVSKSFMTLDVDAANFHCARPSAKSGITADTLCWLALVAIGLPLAYLRYGNVLGSGAIGSLSSFGTNYGLGILLVFHVLGVLAAFKDEFSRGMLALVVPLYSLFFVFSKSDQYVVRVLLGLFLITFAVETYEGLLGFVRTADVRIQSLMGHA